LIRVSPYRRFKVKSVDGYAASLQNMPHIFWVQKGEAPS
jgi:hypothetical protein